MVHIDKKQLIDAARKAAGNAYAPYSNYRVGAAVLCEDGRVFTGCNVENASYGLTMCAERTAIFTAAAAGARKFTAVAIHAPHPPAPMPCGACRQVMSEWGTDIVVLVSDHNGSVREFTLAALLPYSFAGLNPDGGGAAADHTSPG